MAVVKADAYGHGAPWVARAALKAGAALLGVATVGEGQGLRAHGIEAPIVLLGSIDAAEAPAACGLTSRLPLPASGCSTPCNRQLERFAGRRRSRFISRSIPDCVAMAPPPQRRFLSQSG